MLAAVGGCIFDLNPINAYSTNLSGTYVETMRNSAVVQMKNTLLTGSSHRPTLSASKLSFVGSTTSADAATQFLINSGTLPTEWSDTFTCSSQEWKEWTIFVDCQATATPSVTQTIVVLGKPSGGSLGQIALYTTTTTFGLAVYTDVSSDAYVFGTLDTNRHVFEFSSDGAGHLNGWFDGGQVITNAVNFRPQTISKLIVGAGFGGPLPPTDQYNGKITRVLFFPRNMNTIERQAIRTYLG
jgi:hypothetical protein